MFLYHQHDDILKFGLVRLADIVQLQDSCKFYSSLIDDIKSNEKEWRLWYEQNHPESCPIVGYESRLMDQHDVGAFLKVRAVMCISMLCLYILLCAVCFV